MASPSALALPAAAPARHFPISRRGRRVPRRQHPTGPLGGRDVRPCAGARSAARSGRASIVARDGPGLTISTVMDVPFVPAFGDTPCGFASSLLVCRRAGVHLSTSWAVVTCCFCGGCGHLAQKGGLAVDVYLRFCCGAHFRSSSSSSVWSASCLQPEAYFARAGRGCPPSS